MVLDQQVLKLFYPYTRETGKSRKLVSTLEDFTKYVESTSGLDEVYVSSYPVVNNSLTGNRDVTLIDRVIFELDGDLAVHDAKLLYMWAIQNGFSVVPIVSGKKGVHVHILSSPICVENSKEVLTDISTFILSQALGVKSWNESMSIDWTIFGNPRSLIRVPNTLRPPFNNSYCSFLPPNFVDMSEVDIFRYTKSPHVFDYGMSRKKSFLDLPLGVDTEVIKSESLIEPRNMPHPKEFFHPEDVTTFLSHLLSKRRLLQITQTNPPHNIRIITTLELIDAGLHPKEILNLYSGLHWHDWSERISFNFINDLASRYYNGSYKLKRPI